VVSVQQGKEKKLARIGVRDSKMLTRKKREYLYDEIVALAENVKVYKITNSEINKAMVGGVSLNELEAMHFAGLIDQLSPLPSKVFLDSPDVRSEKFSVRISMFSKKPLSFAGHNGKKTKGKVEPLEGEQAMRIISEHKADSRYPVVSCASIIAKVTRDRELDRIEREMGIDIGSGYPSDKKTVEMIRANLRNKKLLQYIREEWKTMNLVRQLKMDDFFK
jgi:ribonuclease HII